METRDMEITFQGKMKVNAIYKGFSIETDQPEERGGDGYAPSPFDLFLASIGTCIGYYLLSFLYRKEMGRDDVRVRLKTEWKGGLVESIVVEIELKKGFPEEFKAPLLRNVELCKIKKQMENPPEFLFSLKEDAL